MANLSADVISSIDFELTTSDPASVDEVLAAMTSLLVSSLESSDSRDRFTVRSLFDTGRSITRSGAIRLRVRIRGAVKLCVDCISVRFSHSSRFCWNRFKLAATRFSDKLKLFE